MQYTNANANANANTIHTNMIIYIYYTCACLCVCFFLCVCHYVSSSLHIDTLNVWLSRVWARWYQLSPYFSHRCWHPVVVALFVLFVLQRPGLGWVQKIKTCSNYDTCLFIFSLHHPMIGHLILTHTHLFSMFGWSCRWKPSFQTRVALASLAESWLPCIPAFMCACGAWTFLNRTPWLSHLQQHATCHSKLKIMKMKPMEKNGKEI